MHRFRPTRLVLIAAFLSVPLFVFAQTSAQNSAKTADELPSAPSAVVQQKPAPQKTAPSPPTEEQPAQTQPSDPAQQASDPTAGNSDTPSNEPPKTASDSTFVKTVNEVPVVFTVTDKHNHYVRDLSKNDFKVLDDGKPVIDVRSSRRETDLP